MSTGTTQAKPELFKVAARRTPSTEKPPAVRQETSSASPVDNAETILPSAGDSAGILATSPEARRQEQRTKAIVRENASNRLKALKREKAKESKHYINVPLDFATKRALENAAHEHGIKMAEIVRDAMRVYLRSAGYLPGGDD